MTVLKMAFHSSTGRRIVEVYDDFGRMVGCIYPDDTGNNGIHIVSRYFDGDPKPTDASQIPVPGYLVKFKREMS